MSECKLTDYATGSRSRLPQPQTPGLASVRRLLPSGSTTKTAVSSRADQTEQRLEISGGSSLKRGHWKQSGVCASYRGNQLSGQAKTHFGNHIGDRISYVTNINYDYSSYSSAANLVAGDTRSGSVGDILCLIEIVASGLSQYHDAIRNIRKVRHLTRSFARLKRELEAESDVLLNSVELLLKGNLPEEDLWNLLGNVKDQDQWQDPRVGTALRHQLGQSYSSFQDSVTASTGAVEELKDSLLISNFGEAPFVTGGRSATECFASLKFGLRMEHYFKYLETVKKCNEEIRELGSHFHMPEAVMPQRSCPNYEKARAYSINVFMMLREAFAKSCNAGHRVSLFLSPVTQASVNRPNRDGSTSASTVVLHHKVVDEKHGLPWTVEETEIRIIKSDTTPDEEFVDDGSRRSKIRFQVPTATFSLECESASSRHKTQQHTLESDLRQCEGQGEKVADLCRSLTQWRTAQPANRTCLGYCNSGENRHGFYWPSESVMKHGSAKEITLATALKIQRGRVLSLLDRRRLALALAVGTLQLYDTPWLSTQWGKNEIVLFTDDRKLVSPGPFVSVDLERTEPCAQYFKRCRAIKNETIFALGIILIELALKESFEALKLPEDAEEGEWHTDFNAADRLTKEVEMEAGPRYADVVRRCVWCEFDHNDAHLEDRKLQDKVYSGVIAVLQEELAYLEPLDTT